MANNENMASQKPHTVSMQNRRNIALTGVEDVVSFDESGVVLKTSQGILSIDGEDMHITKLSLESGEVAVEGTVNALFYISEGSTKKGAKPRGLFK